MVLNGHHSDKTGERSWHIALAGPIGTLAFAISGLPGISAAVGIIAITVATSSVLSALSAFW